MFVYMCVSLHICIHVCMYECHNYNKMIHNCLAVGHTGCPLVNLKISESVSHTSVCYFQSLHVGESRCSTFPQLGCGTVEILAPVLPGGVKIEEKNRSAHRQTDIHTYKQADRNKNIYTETQKNDKQS